jgi:ankyrin repeat protein
MSTKETAKPAPKKKFSKDDVKTLYKAIERGWKEDALSLAFAASGAYKVYQGGRGYLSTGYTSQYWPMQLAIDKGEIELLEAFRPYVDILKEDEELNDSWFGRGWRDEKAEIAALFMSWLSDFRDNDGKWLRIAAANRSMKLVELVLPVSNPLGRSESGETPLMAAAGSMCVEAVARLLPLSDPNAVDDKGRDALMHALEGLLRRAGSHSYFDHGSTPEDRMDCFQSLIDACGVHRHDASGMTAMSRLVQKSEYSFNSEWKSIPAEYAELLVAAGASDDEAGQGEVGLLMNAIDAGNRELFDQLLPSSKLDQVDAEGFTPLLKAAKLGRSKMIAKLAPLSDCDRQSSDGSTALMLSAQSCDLASVRLLCSMTDRSLRDSEGRTAAMIAAENVAKEKSGRGELLIFLRLFDPASAKGQGILPWLVGIPELFEAALPFCDPDDPDPNGQIALHRAIGLGDLGAFERLLPISDVRAADNNGATPLMLSIERGDTRMFHALLPASDAQAVDAKGKTALMLAADRGELEMAQALLPASNVKAADHEGLTALMIAAMNRRLEIAVALMSNSDADAVDKDGKTALMHAMDGWRQDEEVILFLAERSDLPKISKMGRASMEVAMKVNGFPQGAAKKLRGMMSARSERDELLSAVAEPKKPSGERKLDAFYAAPKAKKKPRI